MFFKANVITHFNVQSSQYGDEIDLTQSSSNKEIIDSQYGDVIDLTKSSSNEEIIDSQYGDVIDLTQSSSKEEIIDLMQSDSDYSTTHSFDDELGTSPDDDDRNQIGFVWPDSNISNDDDDIPPPVPWNRAVPQPPAVEPCVGFEHLNIEFNAICRNSTYFHIIAIFIILYTKKLNELISGGGGSYKSASFLACIKKNFKPKDGRNIVTHFIPICSNLQTPTVTNI